MAALLIWKKRNTTMPNHENHHYSPVHLSPSVLLPPILLAAFCALVGCATSNARDVIANGAAHQQSAPFRVNGAPHPTSLGSFWLDDPETAGAELLGDEMTADKGIAEAVQRNGNPDAVQLQSLGSLAMFYKNPPKTRVYVDASVSPPSPFYIRSYDVVSKAWNSTLAFEMSAVPSSVRRMGFGEGPFPPPWPITIPQAQTGTLRVPSPPSSPPEDIGTEGSQYAEYAEGERSSYGECDNRDARRRAADAFARLTPVAQITGIKWQLRVFQSSDSSAFSEPDGSIFVSDTLAQQLNDAELTAILAHEMGHVRYGHDRSSWKLTSTAKKAAIITGIVGLELVVLGLGGHGLNAPAPSDWENTKAAALRERKRENEANWVAAGYLAKLAIPPDSLFNALLKLVRRSGSYNSSTFSDMHYAWRSAADFGRMLDAGIIPGQAARQKQPNVPL